MPCPYPATPPVIGLALLLGSGPAPAPAGKARKSVPRGAFDAMDSTSDAITNYLDENDLDAQDMFIEEYVTDLRKTPSHNLVVDIYVPVK